MQRRRGNDKFGWFRGLTRAAMVFILLMLALQALWTYNMARRPRRGWDMNNRGMPYYAPRGSNPARESQVATEKYTTPAVISVETALSKVQPATRRED